MIRNLNNNIFLFDIEDNDGKMPQLGISSCENNIYFNIVERTETADTIQYKMHYQMAFDIETFASALQTALLASDYEAIVDVTPKRTYSPENQEKFAQVLSLINKIPQMEELESELNELTEE